MSSVGVGDGINKSKQYNCDHCKKSFKTSERLKRHFEKSLCVEASKLISIKGQSDPVNQAQDSTFNCEKCGKGFKTKRECMKHEEWHSYKFTCNVCSRKLKTLNELKAHESAVHGTGDTDPKNSQK